MHIDDWVKLLFWIVPSDLCRTHTLIATRSFTMEDLLRENQEGQPTTKVLHDNDAANFNPIFAVEYLERVEWAELDKIEQIELANYMGGSKHQGKGFAEVLFNTNNAESKYFLK